MRTYSAWLVGVVVVVTWNPGFGYCEGDGSDSAGMQHSGSVVAVCEHLNAPSGCPEPVNRGVRQSSLYGTVLVVETSDVVVEFEQSNGEIVNITNKRCRAKVVSTHEIDDGELRRIAETPAYQVDRSQAGALATGMFELLIPTGERQRFAESYTIKDSGSMHWHGFSWSREIRSSGTQVGFDEIAVRVDPYLGCVTDVNRRMQENDLLGAVPVATAIETAQQELRTYGETKTKVCQVSSTELSTVYLGGDPRKLWIVRFSSSDPGAGASCPLAGIAVNASTGQRDQEVEARFHLAPHAP